MAKLERGIEYFVELANACPSEYHPPDLGPSDLFNWQQWEKEIEDRKEAAKQLKRNPRFRGFGDDALRSQVDICWEIKKVLQGIVRAMGDLEGGKFVKAKLDILGDRYVQIGPDGNMKIVISPLDQDFADSIDRSDARRIRQCYCGNFYNAVRSTRKFCKDDCRVQHWADTHTKEWIKIQNRHQGKRALKRQREKAETEMRQFKRAAKLALPPGSAPCRAFKPPRRGSRPAECGSRR